MYYGWVNGRNCGYHNYIVDDFEIVEDGECDFCEQESCNGCFGHLGRGDGVLVLIKNGQCIKAIDIDDIHDYHFEAEEQA